MKRAVTTVACVAACAMSACGGGDDDRKDADPFAVVEQREQRDDARAKASAAPRWEPVATMRGSGPASKRVTIDEGAVQWRVRWRCRGGRFALSVTPKPREGNPLGRGRCPGKGEATGIDTGRLRLGVRTSGAWRAVVEQQVTTGIDEPPLPAMEDPDATVLAKGRFYAIERRGRGTAILYRLPNGRFALRLERFRTSANSDLFVWVNEVPRPRTTKESLRGRHIELAGLKSTLGSQNYLLPPGTSETAARSVVIWCEPVQITYTAAALR